MIPHNVPLMNKRGKKEEKERYISILDVKDEEGNEYGEAAATRANSKEPSVGPRYRLVSRATTATKRNYEDQSRKNERSAEN